MTDLASALATAQAQVEARLKAAIDDGPTVPSRLREATAYAALGGGKRLRAFLAMESARISGVAASAGLDAGAAVECIHAYSLVHDDLPAMDDDDMRRGKPTCHIAYDPATAILVGDGLQALGFALLAGIGAAPAERVLQLSAGLARAAGNAGMVGGQMRDILAERTAPQGMSGVALIQAQKTGALFEWSATVGPVLAGEDPAPLHAYAEAMGRAFQIRDDLLDVDGDAAAVGKALGKDADAGKATFVSLLGVDGARREAARLIDAALEALAPYGAEGGTLAQLARFTLERSH
ncbi:MAG: farnesyl-diphosphate synthase [Rhodobacterales bacterium]|nr:MAG: farnesyl-diphosphate synthase [Rhodobacterales bacterium]